MKERPIIFSAPMVRAILAGTKTQTRRVVKPQPEFEKGFWCSRGYVWSNKTPAAIAGNKTPYGQPGDRLWVKETGWERPFRTPQDMREGADTWAPYYFDADGLSAGDVDAFKAWKFKRRPSIHMPRKASRITLEITRVRVERLQDISQDDAVAEGCDDTRDMAPRAGRVMWAGGPRVAYEHLWNEINGAGAWALNPWVWVVEFRKV